VRLGLTAAACALGLAACAAPPGPGTSTAAPAPLAGTRWVGVVEGNPDARTLPRLEFTSGGRLAGYTGCNMMSGTWSEEGGEARFGPIIATKRFCAGPEGEFEKRLMAALAPGARGVRQGERLVLIAPGGARFEFSPAAAS
jgi:heat shock protein HslJ